MIAVLGASGYVGKAIIKELHRLGLRHVAMSRATIDYYNPSALASALKSANVEFLINAAGYTGRPNVDACELHKADCLAGNAVLPGKVREACERAGIPWGHVSSGCIFTGDGPRAEGFQETDEPNFCFRTDNCSFYSGSKALGEEILTDAQGCYVWRLRIPFNEIDGPRNYISKLLRYDRLLAARNSLSNLDDFAAACVQCWCDRVPFGIYNLTNPGSVTTREVVELAQKTIAPDRSFHFFESEEEFMKLAAKTPRSNCVLDSSKAIAAGIRLPEIAEALETSLGQWKTSDEPRASDLATR